MIAGRGRDEKSGIVDAVRRWDLWVVMTIQKKPGGWEYPGELRSFI